MRSTRFLAATAAGLMAASLGAPARAGALATGRHSALAPVHVDPVLVAQVAQGPAPALLWWDRARASREEVAAHLDGAGVRARAFEALPGALVCAGRDNLGAIAASPGAVGVFADRLLEAAAIPPAAPDLPGGGPSAVAPLRVAGATGKGAAIAIVDTGVDGTHPDVRIGSRTVRNVRILASSRDAVQGSTDPCLFVLNMYPEHIDDSESVSGHGTALAGIAAGDGTASAGAYRGVAPEATLVGVGVADTISPTQNVTAPTPFGTVEQRVSMLAAIGGINYVLLNTVESSPNVRVLLAGWTSKGLYSPLNPLAWSLADAWWWGVTVVLPVGNDGPEQSDCAAEATCRISTWAGSPTAIAVAATTARGARALEDYSSRGDPEPHPNLWEIVRYEPTIAAPGTGVMATRRIGTAPYANPPTADAGSGGDGSLVVFDRHYVGMTGTAVAAAQVAGVVALMHQASLRSSGCYLVPERARDILRQTAVPFGGHARWETGAGALDAAAAVALAGQEPPLPTSDPYWCPGPGVAS